ncbi:hypothetical protein PF010_g3383 [Phytophthora fragariae]|uniref:Uncharacterized protein n=1 Tax=Phytophthora fragariae TaxID=53985 RepID=A0A6A3FNL7_9STRA|nr:hypothetical protein PF009_g4169 [Phytophthora fragariae]KAE9025472.1 hypothetical protein PF011_g3019 [Phytophthora fragariae]KAE9131898.1 hypothetical protein PF010_g3383 [Phytophthora fragariae]KAE9152521.1 hypothetical protein PF006_g3276 [Phytophthora fragariae]KAE9251534.1 hypothetical protein PF002_g4249 [Phytophthora fragariae]
MLCCTWYADLDVADVQQGTMTQHRKPCQRPLPMQHWPSVHSCRCRSMKACCCRAHMDKAHTNCKWGGMEPP